MRTKVGGLGAFLLAMALLTPAWAQTPQGTSFTYQGRLTEDGALPSGPYDFQFVLYDASVGGTQVGPTVVLDDVTVSAGLFTVNLDFGIVFGGEKRWLELGVRLGADTGPYTPILPRQLLTPGPSAIFSTAAGDSLELGGIPASQYVQTDDARLSDARVPLPGSPDYVQNGSVAQPGVSFNVGGTGIASVLEAATQFNLAGARILSNPGTNNLFTGVNAGASNTTGGANSFFGFNAGRNTTTSHQNSFFGEAAGFNNTTGIGGSFFGYRAGLSNTTADGNAFFGQLAGANNTTGFVNSFFGDFAGESNTIGSNNAFFGKDAGLANTTGFSNAFFGAAAGNRNTTGNENTFVGTFADWATAGALGSNNTLVGAFTRVISGVSNATAIGTRAQATQSNSLVLGGISGVNGGGIDTQVAIGTTTPSARLHIRDNGGNILFGGSAGCPNLAGIVFSTSISATCQNYSMLGGDGSTYINRPGGGTIFFRENNVTEVSIKPGGIVGLEALAGGGTATLCRNPQNEVAFCSSSLRYKTDVQPFSGGLELVNRLQPISFTWKANGRRDVGLGAEDVAKVAPLLAFRNGDGEIEGVNYSQLNVVLVNAVKQQQEQLGRQQQEIEGLRALVCQANPQAGLCLEAPPSR